MSTGLRRHQQDNQRCAVSPTETNPRAALPAALLQYLGECIDQIASSFPSDQIVLAPDMNTLPEQDIMDVTDCCLHRLLMNQNVD